ncbi:MAG: peptide/nickel transport system substrate-binding protein [Candidatus Eremiobacteraeota bacterium]|jgi:peptide/nickel transport system substrate-binding protein|nr:peptide/nickel transport system substrate-binding protein [Candidatus Eremiobacteraeota bacterium]
MRRAAALAAAGALLLGACTKVDVTSSTAAPSGGRHTWTESGHLRYGSAYEPDNLNPLFANTQAANDIAYAVFEPVFRYDPDGNFVPAAVTEVPSAENGGISRDGRTITLHFRPGMKWSDGAPYDARDLVFTWHAVMNPRNNTRLQVGWDDIAAMQLVGGNQTVRIRLKHVNAGVLGAFAVGGAGFPPLPAHLLQNLPDLNQAPFNAKPISSGPFVLREWSHGSALELVPNPHYWRGAPGLTHLTYRFVPNAETLLSQVRTHEVDLYEGVGENQIPELPKIAGIVISKRLSANWRRLAMNTRKPQLSDRRVRQAIAQAVDWDGMNQTVFHGYNERAVSDIVPTSWAAPNVANYPYDVGAAKKLLDAAGWRPGPDGIRARNGVPLRFSVSTTPSKQSNIQAEVLMQQQLKNVGIALEIKNYPGSLLFARDGPVYTGKYDSEFTIETNGPDPDNEGLWSGNFLPPHGTNATYFNDPVVNRVSHEALLTYDRVKRKALYQQEEARIHEQVPAIFFYWQNAYSAVNMDMKNWKPATYISSFWNCYEWSI